MEFYLKDADGNLVLVQKPEDGKKYFDKDGNEVTFKAPAATPAPVAAPVVIDNTGEDGKTDWAKELTGVIREMSGGVTAIKEKQETMEAQLEAYKEAAAKGFPLPVKIDPDASEEEVKEVYGKYNLAMQGKRLMDKFTHPMAAIDDGKRQELAKFYCLFLRNLRDPSDGRVRAEFENHFGKAVISSTEFPVPDIVDGEILTFAREKSVVLQYARIWEMTSEKQSFPAESSGASVAWGSTTGEGAPTPTEVELSCDELSAYADVRDTTLADTRSDIVSWIQEALSEAAALELDNSAFNGDGTSTYGFCSGILTAACGYSVALASGSTAFSNVSASKLSEMISKLDGLKKTGARFWMHGEILHHIRSLEDTNGKPIFIETVGSPMSGTIWGYPYNEVTKCPSTTGANTAFMAFGNLKYFAVGRRLGVTTLKVDPYGLFTSNKTRFKLYQRWALDIGLANGLVRLLTAAQ